MTETIIAAVIGAVGVIIAAWISSRRGNTTPAGSPPPPGAAHAPDQHPTSPSPGRPAGSVPSPNPVRPPSSPHPDSIPRPLPVGRVVGEQALAQAIETLFAAIPPGGRLGGITVGLPRRPRALVYVGPCPDNTDAQVRELAKPYGYNVSVVRNLLNFGGYQTATLDDPQGY